MIKTKKIILLIVFLSIFISCAGNNEDNLKTVNIALELSSVYMRNNEKEEALRVINEALSIVDDIKLVNNKILILESLDRYNEAFDECVKQYIKDPINKTPIYRAIDIAKEKERIDIQYRLYALLIDTKTANINDAVFLLKYGLNLSNLNDEDISINTEIDDEKCDKTLCKKVLKYCTDMNIYNKKYFELAYLYTKDFEYRTAAIYIK